MQAARDYVRLGLGGLFLETDVYREQRESPDGLTRGAILVVIISLMVAVAKLIGRIGEVLTSPEREVFERALYEGLAAMPWHRQLSADIPGFATSFREQFDQVSRIVQLVDGNVSGDLIGLALTPVIALLVWSIYGLFAHSIARLMGGQGTLIQTLGCTALASGANLLGLVQIVPFAQVAGTVLLALLANYVAIREAHALAPWRAFWATLLGPFLLVTLLTCIVCVFGSAIANAVGG